MKIILISEVYNALASFWGDDLSNGSIDEANAASARAAVRFGAEFAEKRKKRGDTHAVVISDESNTMVVTGCLSFDGLFFDARSVTSV